MQRLRLWLPVLLAAPAFLAGCGDDGDKNPVTPAQKADLIVETVAFNPAVPTPTEQATATVTVKNSGSAASTATVLEIKVDGVVSGTAVAVPQVAAGGQATLTQTLTALAAGDHEIQMCVDKGGSVEESDEANNCRMETLTVSTPAAGPDLIIQNMSFSPPAPTSAQSVTVTVTVKNTGTAAAGASTAELKVDGVTRCAAIAVPALAANAEANVTCVLEALPAGGHTLLAVADPANAIPEAGEANNSHAWSLSVAVGDDMEFPMIPAVPILQTVNLNSTDPDAVAAEQQLEQFYLAPAGILSSLGPALIQAIEGFEWQSEGEDCWMTTETEGGCTYTYRMCKAGEDYELEAKATGTCDEGTGLTDFVTWRGTVSLDGRTGEVSSFEPELTGPASTWSWQVSADRRTGEWRGYAGAAAPGDLEWSFDFQQEVGGTQHLVWEMPQAVRWVLDADEAGTQGTLNVDVPGEGGWEDLEEIEWQANGHGTWTQSFSDPPTVRGW